MTKENAEKKLIDIINGCVIDTKTMEGSVLFWDNYNSVVLFEIKNNIIFCDYYLVWSVFDDFRYEEKQTLINKVLESLFKIRGLTPIYFPL